jgi:hypothetical protein
VYFLEVTKEMVGIDVGGEMILPLTGLFALIESLEDPLPHPGKCSELFVKGSKCLTTKQQKKRRQDGCSVRAPNLYLVPVESIDEPISAIPNIVVILVISFSYVLLILGQTASQTLLQCTMAV